MARKAPVGIIKNDVKLITEREHLDLIEPTMCDGFASVFEGRSFTANHSYCPNHDSTEES